MNEAELRACLVGLYISITLHKSIILETNCAFAFSFLANEKLDRSPLVDLKEALSISRLLQNFKISKIDRLANWWHTRLQSIALTIDLMEFFLIVFRPAWCML